MILGGNERVIREIYESLAARDFEAASERMTRSVLVLNVATGDVYSGRAGFLEFVRGWATALPDVRFSLVNIGGSGDKLVVEYEMVGTHTGPLLTPGGHVPPTGMEVHLRFCDVLELSDGMVAHVRSYFDSATLLRQLGVLANTPIHAPDRRAGLELYAQPVETHAPQRNKAIVQRFLQDVFNRQNPGAVADTCSKLFAWHGGSLGEAHGSGAFMNVLSTLFHAFPDFELDVLDLMAETDRVTVRFSMRATHRGEFQGVPPTFRRISGGGTSIYRLDDDKIVEEWWQGDVLALLQQMDAAPSTVPLSS